MIHYGPLADFEEHLLEKPEQLVVGLCVGLCMFGGLFFCLFVLVHFVQIWESLPISPQQT